jgi:hypothetical protein
MGSCSADKWKQHENKLYPDFALATNTALRCLEEIEVKGIRRLDTRVYFHVNDPSLLTQEHKGKVSRRKPDFLLVSDDDMRNACEDGDFLQIHDLIMKNAVKSPEVPFNWRVVRTFVECKSSKKPRGMARPLGVYTGSRHTKDPQLEYLTVANDPILALSITPSASPASSNTGSQPLENRKWLFCSAT